MLFTKSEPEEIYDSTKDTINHKEYVKQHLGQFANHLHDRAECHDDSKLSSPEKETLDKYIPKLKKVKYGTPEYNDVKNEMYESGSNHHFEVNRHHPEYHENGIHSMNLVDLIELICDWKAATMRHNDGDIMKSIQINKERFQYGDEIEQLLLNTVLEYFK